MCLENGKDFGFGDVEAQGAHGDFEFVVVNLLVFVEVEEVELQKEIICISHRLNKRHIDASFLYAWI